jgi:hypothetical protein
VSCGSTTSAAIWGAYGRGSLTSDKSAAQRGELRILSIRSLIRIMLLNSAPGRIRTCAHGSGVRCRVRAWPAERSHRSSARARIGHGRLEGGEPWSPHTAFRGWWHHINTFADTADEHALASVAVPVPCGCVSGDLPQPVPHGSIRAHELGCGAPLRPRRSGRWVGARRGDLLGVEPWPESVPVVVDSCSEQGRCWHGAHGITRLPRRSACCMTNLRHE